MYLLFDIKDILQIINDNINNQINLINYYDIKYEFKIKITYLDASNNKYNQEEIIKDKYKYVKTLIISHNDLIKDINHLTRLEVLYATNSQIDDNGIKNLVNLKNLYANYNKNITNINHMKKLEILLAAYYCGIDDDGIKNLVNLKILYAPGNYKIKDINHMTKLEKLNASNICGINDNGIKNLVNIKQLIINDNKKIKDISHMINLEKLDISSNCNVDVNKIKKKNIQIKYDRFKTLYL